MVQLVQLMILAANVSEALPQILLFEDGIWRDVSLQAIPQKLGDIQNEIEQHLSRIMRQVGGTPSVSVQAQSPGFKAPFRALFKTLLPPDVRDALEKAAATGGKPVLQLFIAPAVEWIPWELLHDGTDFLGIRFAVARLPIVKPQTSVRGDRHRDVPEVQSLLGDHVLDDELRAQWELTFEGFCAKPAWERRFPSNGVAQYPTLTEFEEAKRAGVLHVTCHGGLSEQGVGGFFWSLNHTHAQTFNYRITTSFAETINFATRPLVFGNACASVNTNPGALHGFGSSFMIGGALNFIGTMAPISKKMGVLFARQFYRELFASHPDGPVSVAEALRTTKNNFSSPQPPEEPAGDPSYLFYCLYGPPDATYTPVQG